VLEPGFIPWDWCAPMGFDSPALLTYIARDQARCQSGLRLMAGDLREQLMKIFLAKPQQDLAVPSPLAVTSPKVPEVGAVHPPTCTLSVQETFNRYCKECSGKDFTDPRGVTVSMNIENFPKLIKMFTKASGRNAPAKARAKLVIPLLQNGGFIETEYTWQAPRLESLFWIPDVIMDPDGIYENTAKKIEGEEVYVKRYRKIGSQIKLVFVATGFAGNRIVITSFLDDPKSVRGYCRMPPLYERP
jgi:hypothetical protein